MRLLLNGAEVFRRTDRVAGGAAIRIEPLAGMVLGENELFVEAYPPLDQAGSAHALRLQVFRGEEPIADRTVWAEGGARVAASVVVVVPEPGGEGAHGHP
jgi:hypothetical protein